MTLWWQNIKAHPVIYIGRGIYWDREVHCCNSWLSLCVVVADTLTFSFPGLPSNQCPNTSRSGVLAVAAWKVPATIPNLQLTITELYCRSTTMDHQLYDSDGDTRHWGERGLRSTGVTAIDWCPSYRRFSPSGSYGDMNGMNDLNKVTLCGAQRALQFIEVVLVSWVLISSFDGEWGNKGWHERQENGLCQIELEDYCIET